MSPIHILVWLFAFIWQIVTAISFGGWLGGYGPTAPHDWAGRHYTMGFGFILWLCSFLATVYHDGVLRDIRRHALNQKIKQSDSKQDNKQQDVSKIYQVPEEGLFQFVLYPHYFCEWIEWTAFWVMAGPTCIPARSFLVNEIAAMLPRAVNGKAWYVEKFGVKKIGNKRAVLPGLL
jgi:3-oxo-5-alpha-steroid 4-dehydrogenase 1